jgi:hypothetical protein
MIAFDKFLLELPLSNSRVIDLLKTAGFIHGYDWRGVRICDDFYSIKLPTDGYVELAIRVDHSDKLSIASIIMRDRTGAVVEGMSSDFNVVRQVLACIARVSIEVLTQHAIWVVSETTCNVSNFAYLWCGAVDSADHWVGLATTKFPPTPERVKLTREYFKDMINDHAKTISI